MFLTLLGMMKVILMMMVCSAETDGNNDTIATIEKNVEKIIQEWTK